MSWLLLPTVVDIIDTTTRPTAISIGRIALECGRYFVVDFLVLVGRWANVSINYLTIGRYFITSNI